MNIFGALASALLAVISVYFVFELLRILNRVADALIDYLNRR